MSKLAKFLGLTWPERRYFLFALVLLPMTALSLRFFGLRRTQAGLAEADCRCATPDDTALPRARQTARMVAAASRHGPYRATCLPMSLVLMRLLHRQGIDADLRLGVSKAAPGIEAHAWVEHRGLPLIENHDVHERFAVFDKAVPPGAAAPR